MSWSVDILVPSFCFQVLVTIWGYSDIVFTSSVVFFFPCASVTDVTKVPTALSYVNVVSTSALPTGGFNARISISSAAIAAVIFFLAAAWAAATFACVFASAATFACVFAATLTPVFASAACFRSIAAYSWAE